MSIIRAVRMFLRIDNSRRQEVKEAVDASTERRDQAKSRFEDTIRELMEVNDKITGRNHAHHS